MNRVGYVEPFIIAASDEPGALPQASTDPGSDSGARQEGGSERPKDVVDEVCVVSEDVVGAPASNGCNCDCQNGILRLLDSPEDDLEDELRCECRVCGSDGSDGRQCLQSLNSVAARLSFEMDGHLICFECRGGH